MIAKEVPAPKGQSSFSGLVSYLTSSQGLAERVGRIQVSNCVSTEHEGAVLEVLNIQAQNHRASGLTYHLVLSFRQGEKPSADVLQAVEERACAALGFSEHQRVSVVHEDTDNVHLHVAISRVHPESLTAHSPSYSKLALDRECVMLERDFGLAPDHHQFLEREEALAKAASLREQLTQRRDRLERCGTWAQLHDVAAELGLALRPRGRGLSFVDRAGHAVRASSVSRGLSKAALERRLGPFEGRGDSEGSASLPPEMSKPSPKRALDMEQLGGSESLVGFIQRRCGQGLHEVASWAELHELAGAQGLQVKLRGNGLVLVSGDQAVKGSSVSRGLSKAALEKRLGPFQAPGSRGSSAAKYTRRPVSPSNNKLYEQYQRQRERAQVTRERELSRLQLVRQRERERAAARGERRWAAVKLMSKGRVSAAIWAAEARRASRRDLERVDREHRAAVRRLRQRQPSPSWVEWLRAAAEGGNDEALDALRRRRKGGAQKGNGVADATRRQVSELLPGPVESVTSSGTVTYRVGGGRIRDDGIRLSLDGGSAPAAAAELLRLAKDRYGGRLAVDGDVAFKEQLAWAAASEGIEVTFIDAELEQRRRQLWEELSYVRRRAGDERRAAGHADGRARAERSAEAERAGSATRGARLGEPDPRVTRSGPPAQPRSGVRGLSEVDVVRFGQRAEGLLPRDARRDVDQRGAADDRGVRRGDAGRVTKAGPERRTRPKGRSR